MAQAPAVDGTLTLKDARKILEELLEAQNHSSLLGLTLNLRPDDIKATEERYSNPRERLLHIIIAFLNQAEPRPTWRVIVDALKNPVVNLTALAGRVEAAHFPNPDATSVPPTQSGPVQDATTSATSESSQAAITTPSHSASFEALSVVAATTSEEVKKMISDLDEKFDTLKNFIRECLYKSGVQVKRVADILTSLSADEDEHHKVFLESHVSALFKAADISEQFGTMNFHWNYLNPTPLDHLAHKCGLKNANAQMETYKSNLRQFRMKTPLTLFCQTQRKRSLKPPGDFQEMVAEFDWPDNVTLEVVEQFREEYASHYNLRECAMMLSKVLPGSFIITWLIPESIIKKLKENVPREILQKFSVTKLHIAGDCVYHLRKPQEKVPATLSKIISPTSATSVGTKEPVIEGSVGEVEPPLEDDYLFLEQPSNDFFCPVTFGLLLQPHLTSCCGKHLSQESATRIQKEGGACPLCKKESWSTVLNKHFQRQVNSLRVFCCYKERGCVWQGELAAFNKHIESCHRDGPLMSELAQLPLYRDHNIPGSCSDEEGVCGKGSNKEKVSETETSLDKKTVTETTSACATSTTARPSTTKSQLSVQCLPKQPAPCEMARGSTTTDGQTLYFAPDASNRVYKFEPSTEIWERLPTCPHRDTGLVIINGELTAVGGEDYLSPNDAYTNILITLEQKEWREKYPPMNTVRSCPAIVTTADREHFIVIGGYDDGGWNATVELFQVRSNRWYQLNDIPNVITYPSATICGNELHVIGIGSEGYSCSLPSLPSKDPPSKSQLTLHWNPLPPMIVTNSTIATLCGQVVLIGGLQEKSPVNSIYQLVDREWINIGSMAKERNGCLVASPSHDKLIIVGGRHRYDELRAVEECVMIL